MSDTELDTPFDVDTEEGTPPRELIPPGKYEAEITTARVGETKNGRGTMANLTWTIVKGDYEKRLVFQNILVRHESKDAERFGRQKFRDVCVACGVSGQITNLDVLLYKPCLLTLIIRKDKTGEYPDKNEVANVLPVVPGGNGSKPAAATVIKEATAVKPAFKAPADKSLNDEIPEKKW